VAKSAVGRNMGNIDIGTAFEAEAGTVGMRALEAMEGSATLATDVVACAAGERCGCLGRMICGM
jgi:hypothetical protein